MRIKDEIIIAGKITKFPDEIEQVIKNDEYTFVRLAVRLNGDQTTDDEISNVYALTNLGEMAWQIKNIPPKENPDFGKYPIVSIEFDEKKEPLVTDFMGRVMKVDTETGNLNGVVDFRRF